MAFLHAVTMPVATIASTQHLISSEGSYVPDSKQLLLTSLFSQTSSMQSTSKLLPHLFNPYAIFIAYVT